MVSGLAISALSASLLLSSAHFALQPKTPTPKAPPERSLLYLVPPSGPVTPKILSFDASAARPTPGPQSGLWFAQASPSRYSPFAATADSDLGPLLGRAFFSLDGRELGQVLHPADLPQRDSQAWVVRLGGFMGAGGREITLSADQIQFFRDPYGHILAVSPLSTEAIDALSVPKAP